MTNPLPLPSDPHAEASREARLIEEGRARWQAAFDAAQAAGRVRDADVSTLSGRPVEPLYAPRPGDRYEGFERIGWPGEFPFTRGLHPTGYRGKPWTIRRLPASATRSRPTSATGCC